MRIPNENKIKIENKYPEIIISLENSILNITSVLPQLKKQKTIENLQHGVIRRGFINAHCLRRIYKISPPTRTEHLTHEEREDITVFLLTFLFNISGIIDNLSWAWFYEKEIYKKKDPNTFKLNVHLFNKKFKKYLPVEVNNLLQKFDEWQKHIKDFRDPIAHRIPPYVIPFFVNHSGAEKYKELQKQFSLENDLDKKEKLLKQMDTLGDYEPTYTHSISEGSPLVAMHPQLLADTNTIVEIIKIIIKNL